MATWMKIENTLLNLDRCKRIDYFQRTDGSWELTVVDEDGTNWTLWQAGTEDDIKKQFQSVMKQVGASGIS